MALGLPNTARNGSPSYELGRLRTPQSFDVVTLWDVIEHVEHPADLPVNVCERLISLTSRSPWSAWRQLCWFSGSSWSQTGCERQAVS